MLIQQVSSKKIRLKLCLSHILIYMYASIINVTVASVSNVTFFVKIKACNF